MARVRKTLGSAEAPCLMNLKTLVDSLPKRLVAGWSVSYAETHILPVYARLRPGDNRPALALEAARGWLLGLHKLPFVRDIILNQAHAAAREPGQEPAAQAAARAVAQAASAIHSKRHALGIAFYGAAALAYEALGTGAPAAAYQQVFEELCAGLTASLEAAARMEAEGEGRGP